MDAGILMEDGNIAVMARSDDVINVAGHRLSTGALEEVLDIFEHFELDLQSDKKMPLMYGDMACFCVKDASYLLSLSKTGAYVCEPHFLDQSCFSS